MSLLYDTYFVVALSFVLFLGVLWHYDVHKMLGRALDARADRIRDELDEAKRLREEAQTLLASYERKQKDVEAHAADIVARAKEDAEAAASQARKALAGSIDRRIRAAVNQIASAEAAAVREVTNRAVTVAVAAAGDVISQSLSAEAADARITTAIDEVGARLH
jgi:F-type H+-transporting ATPase subunit b